MNEQMYFDFWVELHEAEATSKEGETWGWDMFLTKMLKTK